MGFYSNLSLEQDTLGSQYIALSSVAQRGRNPKKFVIGVLPPVGVITGRILDRSASIPLDAIIPSKQASEQRLRTTQAEEVSTVEQIENKQSRIPTSFRNFSKANIRTLRPEIQPLAEELVARCAAEGIPLIVTVGTRTNEQQDKIYAQGRTPGNNQPLATGAKGGQSKHNYGVAFDTAIIVNGKESQSRALWEKVGAIGEEIGLAWGAHIIPPPPDDLGHFQYDGGLTIEQLKAGVELPAPPFLDTSVRGDTQTGNWQKDGAQSASTSRQQQAQLANTDLNSSNLGLQFQAAQRAQIRATQEALTNLQNVPPLRMLVNPKSFTVRGEKITQDGNWGRNGPIIEHWGDNQDKISGSGSVAGFYALTGSLAPPPPGTSQAPVTGSNGPGLTRMARNFSMGYQNFMSLYLLYRNNAGLYIQDYGSVEQRLNLSTLGSIYIYYDNILYIGSFDTFNVTEDDTRPFTLDYSFEFTVRASFLLDRPTDQGFTYGFPAIATTRTAPKILPTGSTGDVGGQASSIPGLTNEELADFIANDNPQAPGNEAGAQLTKQQIQDEMTRLQKKFENGEITPDFYFKQLNELQGKLASVT